MSACAVSAPERDSRVAANQLRTASTLLQSLAPHVATDVNLPSRVKELSGERRFNSSTRRLYRELLFTYVRFYPWLASLSSSAAAECSALLAPHTPEVVRLLQSSAELSGHALAHRGDLEDTRRALQHLVGDSLCSVADLVTPPWLQSSGQAVPPDVALTRPPLYIRVYKRSLLPAIEADAHSLGARVEPTVLGDAFRVSPLVPGATFDLTATDSFARAGAFEVQDLGSQMLLEALAPPPGPQRWLDACAGAGGKTLQLAAMLGPSAQVHAEDVRRSALEQLAVRAARCGLADRITTAPSPSTIDAALHGFFDGVLVDAPCTGSGTWRRSPHLRWQITPERVQAAAEIQLQLLMKNAPRVKPGGLVVYSTCSQASTENEAVVRAFLQHAGSTFERADLPGSHALGLLQPEQGQLVVSPSQHNTDAFYIAALRRAG